MQKKRTKIIIIGAVGTALNVIEQIIDARDNYRHSFEPEGILIDSLEKGALISGVPVIGALKDASLYFKERDLCFLFALYKPEKLSNIRIGNHCFFGLNSSVREGIKIGSNVYASMQSAVFQDYDNEIIAGIPAKSFRNKTDENSL